MGKAMTDNLKLDEERAKFEIFAEKEQLSLEYGDCGYVYSSTEMAWRSWLARALLETSS